MHAPAQTFLFLRGGPHDVVVVGMEEQRVGPVVGFLLSQPGTVEEFRGEKSGISFSQNQSHHLESAEVDDHIKSSLNSPPALAKWG